MFIIAIVSFGGSIIVFMASIINTLQNFAFSSVEHNSTKGSGKRFFESKLTKLALGLFVLYVMSYAVYIFIQLL